MDEDKRPNCLEHYVYANRCMHYRSEKFQITQSEYEIISGLKSSKSPIIENNVSQEKVCVIIDTDIGTDLDDSLALLYALRIPNLEILGITTNYCVSEIRSKIVEVIVNAHRKLHPDYPEIPIVTGSSRPLGTHRDYFLTNYEGFPLISSEFKSQNWIKQGNTIEQFEAADFIAETINKNPNKVTICSIGIPTNIALAFKRHPEIIPLVKEIVVMGGGSVMSNSHKISGHEIIADIPKQEDFVQKLTEGNLIHLFPNHNLSGDTLASREVFNHQIRIKIIPHDVTRRFWLEGRAIDHLMAQSVSSDTPSGIVGILMKIWFELRHGQNGQCPHDPLTVHECFGSALKYVRGWFILHEWAAFATFVPDPNGPHLLAVDEKDVSGFLKQLEDVLCQKD